MFSTRNLLLAGALLSVSAPALVAQQGGGYGQPQQSEQHDRGQWGGQGRGERGMRSPVQALMEHRADLNLSDDQVNRLQQIDADLQRRTEPLRQQLEQYRGQFQRGQDGQQPSDEDRDAMRQRMQQARPIFEQLRKANQDAMQRAMRILTPEQRQQAQSLMPQRGERGGRGGRGQGGWNRQGQTGGQQQWNRGGTSF